MNRIDPRRLRLALRYGLAVQASCLGGWLTLKPQNHIDPRRLRLALRHGLAVQASWLGGWLTLKPQFTRKAAQ